MRLPRRKGSAEPVHAVRRTGQPSPRFNYELFNCNNFNIRYWSWNYRGCWPAIRGGSRVESPLNPLLDSDSMSLRRPPGAAGILPCVTAKVTPRHGMKPGGSFPYRMPGGEPRAEVPTDIGSGASWSTRLALQLFLVKGFKLYSFQLQDPKEPCISIYCHYLPVSGLGNLRACCLPWMW